MLTDSQQLDLPITFVGKVIGNRIYRMAAPPRPKSIPIHGLHTQKNQRKVLHSSESVV